MRSAISIDVDPLSAYHEIHGLAPPDVEDVVSRLALPRFFELLENFRAPSTLFMVGREAAGLGTVVRPGLASTRSELASHSFAHDYHLSTLPKDEIHADLARAEGVLEELGGEKVRGFRAPGYNVSPALMEVLVERGYAYDSSLLPSPAYFAARAAVVRAYAAVGRTSRSLVGDVRQFLGRGSPYRAHPKAMWTRDFGGPLVEVPMGTLAGVPLIGTLLGALGPSLGARLVELSLRRRGFFALELHAIDFLDRTDHPALAALAAHQKDLTRPAAQKIAAYSAVVEAMTAAGPVETLGAIAAEVA